MAGNFFESKFMQKLQVGGQKIAANKGVSAIIAAMMSMMAVILVGAAFQIVATLANVTGLATTDSDFYKLCMVPYNMTMGLHGAMAGGVADNNVKDNGSQHGFQVGGRHAF